MNLIKKLNVALALGLSLSWLPLPVWSVINLTLKATALTSSVEQDGNSASLVSDGAISGTRYWNSRNDGTAPDRYEYVEVAWKANCEITSSVVYWAVDGDAVTLPEDAYLARWDGHDWVKAYDVAAPNERNISSTTATVVTNRVRLYVKGKKACGIYELRLFGNEGEALSCDVMSVV